MTGATTNNPWVQSWDPEKLEHTLQVLRDRAAAGGSESTFFRYANGDELFALYLALADRRCRRTIGLSIFDLGDVCWHDWYSDGRSIREAVMDLIENDDMGSMILADLHGELD